MSHCRTKKHITNLVNSFDDKKVEELLELRLDNEYIQTAYCPYCGSIKIKVYQENKKKQWPNRLFCSNCRNVVPRIPLTPEPKKEECKPKRSQTDLMTHLGEIIEVDFSNVTYHIRNRSVDNSEDEADE